MTPRDSNVVINVCGSQPSCRPHSAQWEVYIDGRISESHPTSFELDVYPSRIRQVGSTPYVHCDEPPRPSFLAEQRCWIIHLESNDVANPIFPQVDRLSAPDIISPAVIVCITYINK